VSGPASGLPLEQWTWQELLAFNQGSILLAIPKGEFNQAVHSAMELTTRWVQSRKEKKA
jgi:hypothetical protein